MNCEYTGQRSTMEWLKIMKHNIDKIGKVDIEFLYDKTEATYSDGEIEDDILKIVSSPNFDHLRDHLLSENNSWPIYYHLSHERGGIVDWYNFSKGSRVLEFGSGCGAITETLVKKDISVTSLELSPKRATINAQRNNNAGNLSIVVGNLEAYEPKEKFDYVVCVGVLEYAGTFINSKDPYISFLKKLHSFLNEGGILLLAIENQLGFKYFAGAREDHTGKYFDGINNYPESNKIKTFGRLQLKRMIIEADFKNSYFYFPFPDYKFPSLIYSEDYYPGKDGVSFPLNLLPTPTPDGGRQYVFSEAGFMAIIEQNGIFPDVSNSFLIEASR